MSNEKKIESLPMKAILQGVMLILFSNLVYIGNNYIVAWTHLQAPEIAMARGTLQIIVFGIIIWRGRQAKQEDKTSLIEEKEKSSQVILLCQIVLYGLTISTMSFAFLAAIPYMPLGDLIVISFASPVFSVFLDRIVLKRLLTFLSVGLCFLIVVGDVLVVQPPFIFGEDENIETSKALLSEEETGNTKRGGNYYVGVGLGIYAAAAGAVANVTAAKCSKKKISSSQLMFVSGISSLILSFVSVTFLPNRLLTNPYSLSLKAAILLPVSGCITMVAYWTITLAISITHNPTLISMLRSTEILIILVTEALWWNELPGTTTLLGSLLVAACVLTMAAHDKIIAAFKKKETKEEEV